MVFESGQAVGVKVNHIHIGHPSLNEEPFRDQSPQNEEHDEKIEFQLPLNAMRNSDIRRFSCGCKYNLTFYVAFLFLSFIIFSNNHIIYHSYFLFNIVTFLF